MVESLKDDIQETLDNKDELLGKVLESVTASFEECEEKKPDVSKGGQLVISEEAMQSIFTSFLAMESKLNADKIGAILAKSDDGDLKTLTDRINKELSGGKEPSYTCAETVKLVELHLKYLFNVMETLV